MRCRTAKSASSTTATPNPASVSGASQPASPPCITAKISAHMPTVPVSEPSRSIPPAARAGSAGTSRSVSTSSTTAIGALNRNTHCQPIEVSGPPDAVPSTPATEPTLAKIDSPLLRARASVNSPSTSAIAAGQATAADRPCPARAATSCHGSAEIAHSVEVTVSATSPPASTRR